MGLTERHWFENEDVPENYEWALEDAAYSSHAKEKEPEARVLTLEEVPDAVFCYLEYKAYGTIEPAIFGEADIDDTIAFTTLEDGKDYLDLSDYYKAWRCWTARPTEEQRKAVKWDD